MMVVLCVDVFLGVFSRYVLRSTFTWYDEIARLLFVWMVFLGAAVGVRQTGHFRLHLVIDRFPPALRRAAEILSVLAIMLFGAVLVQQGWKLVELGQFQQTPVMGLSKRYVYSSMLLAIPLFILAGALMETGGIAVRLVRLAQVLVGWIRGGLSMAVVVAEYIFSGISGSTVADVSAIGSTMIPPMLKAGYSKEQAVAVVSAA